MIEDTWEKMGADPMAKGYSFRKIGMPNPDMNTISECRVLCEQNLCGVYGLTWGCPPGVGSGEECLAAVASFSKAALITRKYEKIDTGDKELLERLGIEHREVCRRFGNALRREGFRVLPLADGGCRYCRECTYPGSPCRFPDQRVPSISGFGIFMDKYMKSQNIDFSFEKNSATLYGLILYDEPRFGK
ncbi:MAG: DUF2284 domain-containing protein [Candidatus Methanoplasma sp.]|jgi:predicted metal-binding protein|nr:DUF2284 domain-containing protein [Candidatus Methanoplasma sp.]